jgi:hypothetical protein
LEEGFIDNVVIIHIKSDFIIVKVKINDVTHWHPSHIVAGRARTPVFTEVSKHIDMITQKVEDRLVEKDGECPLAASIPLQWGRHLARNLGEHEVAQLMQGVLIYSLRRIPWSVGECR